MDYSEPIMGMSRTSHGDSDVTIFFSSPSSFAMSEIDDIFAGKAKGKLPSSPLKVASSSSHPPLKKDKKKKRKTKLDVVPDDPNLHTRDASAVVSSSKKRPPPETVVDTSHRLSGPSKRRKGEQAPDDSKPLKSGKSSKKSVNDDVAFKDSRGSSDRRKTEEGWIVYKEDELGIGDEGGGKLLCVRDFLLFTAILNQTLHCVPLIVIAVFESHLPGSFFCNVYLFLFSLSSKSRFECARLFRSLSNRIPRLAEVNL
ncbi:hypothetical protein BDZ97DRAFT_1777382 [Flammula alnicola]|nr:hypothetical protein BDZ97DRAFT_1777382 [Flammula alnicola]